MDEVLFKDGKWEIIRNSERYPIDDLDDEYDTSMHISTMNNKLSEEELEFEIADKINLIEELIRRRGLEGEREIRLT